MLGGDVGSGVLITDGLGVGLEVIGGGNVEGLGV